MNYIVVGAGILGASTAYHLVKAGANVTLVDRRDEGQATGVAAGMICPWMSQRRNQAWYTLAKNGAKYYPELVAELEACGEMKIGYRKVGALSIHTDDAKLDKIEERVLKRLHDAPEIGEVRRLSTSETKAMLPLLGDKYRAVYVSGAARVNGSELRDALIKATLNRGATFIEGNAKLVYEGSSVIGVEVNEQLIYADKVIVTAGAWVRELLEPLGLSFLIEPQKAQIVHLEGVEGRTETWPVVIAPTNKYMLPFERGRIVVGTTYEDHVGFDSRVTAGGVHEILDQAFMIAPALTKSTIAQIGVGFRPVAPGFHPVIGELPNYEGVVVANGLGASGLTVGPYLGSELARFVLGEVIELDLDEYNVERALGENEAIPKD